MCVPTRHSPSSNEISALSKTGFLGPGKVNTKKSVALWTLLNSATFLGFYIVCILHGPDLSSLPSPVSGRGGQPRRVGIVLWVLHLRECCGYLRLLGTPIRSLILPCLPLLIFLTLCFPKCSCRTTQCLRPTPNTGIQSQREEVRREKKPRSGNR